MDEYGDQIQLHYEDNFDYEQELHHHQQEEDDELATDYGIETNDKQPMDHHHHRDHDRDSSFGKLFVGGVSWETTEETFANYFSKYGEITDSVIMRDKHSGRPRGFGFVTFADPAVADKVLEEDHVIDGGTVEVKRTVPREDIDVKAVTRTKKIFVGGIPPSLADDELKEYFSLYGTIVEHQIMLDHKTGRSRGFGFVTFENEDAVEKVFSEGRTHELGGKEVEIKKAVPKRAGGDYGSTAKSYAGFSRGAGGYGGGRGGGYSSGGRYGGKMGRGFGGSAAYGGYGGYGGYGNYGGSYGGGAAGFYGGYGGYGYGFGFGGPMYGGVGYGGSGYGTPSGYGGAAGYSGGKGYGRSGSGVDDSYGGGRGYGNDGDGRGYGNGGDASYGGGRGYGNGGDASYGDGRGYGNAGDGSYGGGKGYGNGSITGRYHPYRK